MSKVLIIGDLHGRLSIVEKAFRSGYKCVFIGDYLDSYDKSPMEQVETLGAVLGAVGGKPDMYTALIGNHELSYLDRDMQCSGYTVQTQMYLKVFQNDIEKYLKPYTYVGNFLVSHAGVSQAFLEHNDITLDEYLTKGDYNQIGYTRGGAHQIGGLYWCDWFQEFEPIPGQPQIVGHSGYRPPGSYEGILERDGNFNVDCYEYKEQFLLVDEDTSEVRVITLEEGL